jgi:hypothetical protein
VPTRSPAGAPPPPAALRWVADSAHQIDYWITAGDTPAHIMEAYAEATGHPPLLPEWAAGFRQSKLRYRTQDELLAVAREYKERGLPLSVMVCDFFHRTHMGDWDFDPTDWPDPGTMIKELESPGVKLAVSVWPTVDPGSRNHDTLHDGGLLVGDSHGGLLTFPWPAQGHGTDYQPMTIRFGKWMVPSSGREAGCSVLFGARTPPGRLRRPTRTTAGVAQVVGTLGQLDGMPSRRVHPRARRHSAAPVPVTTRLVPRTGQGTSRRTGSAVEVLLPAVPGQQRELLGAQRRCLGDRRVAFHVSQ